MTDCVASIAGGEQSCDADDKPKGRGILCAIPDLGTFEVEIETLVVKLGLNWKHNTLLLLAAADIIRRAILRFIRN